jgi:hypothetical protein
MLLGDAHRRDLPDAMHPPQDRSIVTRFDGLNGAGHWHPHGSKMLLGYFPGKTLAQSVAKPHMRRIAVEPWMPSH